MTTAVIVMEQGSDWPGHLGDALNVVAITHADHELVQRTREKVNVLHGDKHRVRVAVLACGNAEGDIASARRFQLARLLLSAVMSTMRGRLLVSANGRASFQLRRELLALADTLTIELRGTTATISLRFTERPPRCS